MVSKECYGDLNEKFQKALKRIQIDSQFDPVTEPFLSRYAGRQILIALAKQLSEIIEEQSTDGNDYVRLIGMHGGVELTLGMIAFDTEENSIGEQHLKACEKITADHFDKPECAGTTLKLYNQLGVHYHNLETEDSLSYLLKAEDFYKSYKLTDKSVIFINDLFSGNITVDGLESFEANHTLTLFYLAQAYSSSSLLTSGIYCHRTLRRQLGNCNDGTFDPIDWALNSATLSQYFLRNKCFKQARHHLAASAYVLERYSLDLDMLVDDTEENCAKKEQFRQRSADVDRCFAKYCFNLLTMSKDRLMSDEEPLVDVAHTDIALMDLHEQPECSGTVTIADVQDLQFSMVDLAHFENIVTDRYLSVYADAKPVFVLGLKYLTSAQSYYTLDEMASDYVEIVQEQSKMYSLTLPFFEENMDNCAKLFKRAIDLLENVLKQISHKHYQKYCLQMWHRLGQLYACILDIKIEKQKEPDARPNPEALNKINGLIDKSIYNFVQYLNSFAVTEKLSTDDLEPYLLCNFSIASLSRKYITCDKRAKLRNATTSLKHFNIVLDYCNKYEEAKAVIPDYIPIAKELVQLIPLEIKRYELEVGPHENNASV